MAGTKSVLVIDPQEEIREQCRAILSGEGFEVRLGERREDVLKALSSGDVDAIVIALFLTDGPAYQLFAEALLGDIAVIGLMDIFAGPTVKRLMMDRYPFLALLNKPLTGANLVDLMRAHFAEDYPEPPPGAFDDGEARALQRSFERRVKDTGTWPRRHRSDASVEPVKTGKTDVGVLPQEESEDAEAHVMVSPHKKRRVITSTHGPLDPEQLEALEEGEAELPLESSPFKRIKTSPRHALTRVGAWVPDSLEWRGVPDTGQLSKVSFAALLARVHNTRFTGLLKLWREHVRKVLHFDGGVPVAAHSNLIYEYLGHILVREGLITDALAKRANQKARAEERRLGEVLIEVGALDVAGLEGALELQLRARILDVFGWSGADYALDSGSRPSRVVVQEEERAQPLLTELVFEGVLGRVSQERVLAHLERCLKQNIKPRVERERFDELVLTSDQREIVEEIFDGGTLLELVAQFEQSSQAYRFIYGLAALGLIAFQRSPKV